MANNEPEVLARHLTEAGLIANAARQWGKAGRRSLDRSALIEAVERLARALPKSKRLPPTPALRREQIELQVALIAPLIHVKGYAASETKAAAEQARLLIEQAEAIGEAPEDPELLFSVFYSFWVANLMAFNGDVCRNLAADFLTLAEKQRATVPRMIGHRLMGTSLICTGEIAEGASLFRSRACAVQPHGSYANDAIWCGHWSVNLYLSVVGSLDAWLSPGRARRCKPRAQAVPASLAKLQHRCLR